MFVMDQVISEGLIGLMENIRHIASTYHVDTNIEINRNSIRIKFSKGLRGGTYDISLDSLKTGEFDIWDESIYQMFNRTFNN